jgi:Flp pilus assembly protein CpaB
MNRTALLISAATTLAGIVALRLYMQRFEAATAGGPATRVLVLVEDIAAGTPLRREMLGTRELAPVCLESRHVLARDIDQVLDARVGIPARANEALLWTDLGSMREPARQLSKLVPEGMRALTLGSSSSVFDSLIAPGDRVDVLVIPHDGRSEPHDLASMAAENLLVLAVGNDLGGLGHERDAKAASRGQVTVSVTPEQGARLAETERRGALRLVLRNADDIAVTGRSDANVSTITTERPPALRSGR